MVIFYPWCFQTPDQTPEQLQLNGVDNRTRQIATLMGNYDCSSNIILVSIIIIIIIIL